MAYSKSCLLGVVFAALLLLTSHTSARELAEQTQQSVQPEGVEDDLHMGHYKHHHHHHRHHYHHYKHEHKHHKKPGHGHGPADDENMESEMENGEN